MQEQDIQPENTLKIDTTTTNQYPWSQMWEKCENKQDLLASPETPDKNRVMELDEIILSQQNVMEEQTRTIQELNQKITNMTKVSQETFDKLQQMVTNEKQQLLLMNEKFTEMLAKQQENTFKEIEYAVLVQSILTYKSQKYVNPEKQQQQTLKNVLKWLAQRESVIGYLRGKNLFLDMADDFESLLHVEKKDLIAIIKKYHI